MANFKFNTWIKTYKIGIIIGFIFGAFIAPFIGAFGLVLPLIESIRPLLLAPMDFLGSVIPNVQIAPDTYVIPSYKWVLTLLFNGLAYGLLGGYIQQRKKLKKQVND